MKIVVGKIKKASLLLYLSDVVKTISARNYTLLIWTQKTRNLYEFARL